MTLPLLTALLCLAAARAQAADPGACYAIQAPERRAECISELRNKLPPLRK